MNTEHALQSYIVLTHNNPQRQINACVAAAANPNDAMVAVANLLVEQGQNEAVIIGTMARSDLETLVGLLDQMDATLEAQDSPLDIMERFSADSVKSAE